LKAITFREGDKLISSQIVHDEDTVLLVSANGASVHFDSKILRPMSRTAMGVRGMKLRDGDRLIGMEIIHDMGSMLLTVTERGYGKRTPISEHRLQGRGGMGIRAINVNSRNGKVVGAYIVQDDDHLMLATDNGTIIRTRVSEIRITGRSASGVRLMNVGENEHVVAVAAFSDESDDEVELTSVPVDDNPIDDGEELPEDDLDESVDDVDEPEDEE
jgi:DNA gyrase subunit A